MQLLPVEISMGFLKNLKIDLPYGPKRPLLDIYKGLQFIISQRYLISMFAAVLLITAKLQNRLRCSTVETWTQTT